MDVDPMVSKSEIGHFQLGKGPRNLCEPSDNLRYLNYKLSPSLLSPPVVWPGGENMMKPWVWIWRVKVSSNIAYKSGPGSATSTLAPPIHTTQIFFSAALFISLHGARPPAMGLARSDSSVSRVWWLISLAQAGPSSRKVGVAFLTLSLDDNR